MSLLFLFRKCLLENFNKGYLNPIKLNLGSSKVYHINRFYSQKHDNENKFIPFDKLSNSRSDEAKRSILVQVNSEQSFSELHEYCTQFGKVNKACHFIVSAGHFMLIEFCKESEVALVLKSSNHISGGGVPTQSPFLWFRAVNNSPKHKKSTKQNDKLLTINGLNFIQESELIGLLKSAKSVDEQILTLYKSTCLNDLEIRLRYFAARQIELVLSGLFPNVNVRPFGSSVSGFGKQGCDLDLVLRLDKDDVTSKESRFVFHTKTTLNNGRVNTQRQMEVVGDLLQLFTPGCANVRKILQARVPIIKYYQEYVGLECDLSMTNLTGVYMSEMLYILGNIDDRVRPLMFAIRRWAKSVGLTNSSPGRWISNFSLTLLVIFALQQSAKKSPVLPKIKLLIENAGKEDMRITEDHINCSFLRDINNQHIWDLNNKDSLHELLLNFFEFYSSFDFNSHAISVIKGIQVSKPDHSPMYIINPLEPQLNVSKNVSYEETQRFKIEVRNAAWMMESVTQPTTKPWGLLSIFQNHQSNLKTPDFFMNNNKPRMMDVKKLFEEENGEYIELKNDNVRQEIANIKRSTSNEIKRFKSPRARRR